MIYLWSYTDFGQDETQHMPENLGPGGEWKHERIYKIDHVREAIPYHVKKQVREKNDAAAAATSNGRLICNHYVPYCRIKDALLDRMKGRTRAEIINELYVIREPFEFTVEADPWESKHSFHTWVNAIFNWICNWSENLFYGPPFGDNGGRKIDIATTGSADLNFRLQQAAMGYWEVLDIDVGDHNDDPDPNNFIMDGWDPFLGEDGELEN